jgi:hypothetical protein
LFERAHPVKQLPQDPSLDLDQGAARRERFGAIRLPSLDGSIVEGAAFGVHNE